VLTCVIKAVSAVRQHDSSFNFPVTIETPDGLRVPVPGHTPNLGLAHIARNLAASATALPNDQRPSAILSVGIATKKAVWNGEEFTPRLVLPLTLSCDPSVANGAHATRLLADVAGVLADFRQTLL
jgi:pyruvate/2-oxoglutarate dehydrogenase complex dihydrolipoamide acyltransferase (E2) component